MHSVQSIIMEYSVVINGIKKSRSTLFTSDFSFLILLQTFLLIVSSATIISAFPGYSGYSGDLGNSGHSGYSGNSGHSGYSGNSGNSGYSDYSGYSGQEEISGVDSKVHTTHSVEEKPVPVPVYQKVPVDIPEPVPEAVPHYVNVKM